MAFVRFRILGVLLASWLLGVTTCAAQGENFPSSTPPAKHVIVRSLSGVVQDTLGRGLVNAAVALVAPDGKTVQNTTTAGGGRFA